MRLTKFSDYALRVLLYAASTGDGRLVTIEDTAAVYGISRAHLKKVVTLLTQEGFLRAVRGRAGGFGLAMSPERINLGAVVRATEPDFALAECFQAGNTCRITRQCRLPEPLNEALAAFIRALDAYTLADLLVDNRHFVEKPKLPLPLRGRQLPPPPPQPQKDPG